MKNIVLIGMMGCGKTTVGRILAHDLARRQIDTDSYIEAQTGRTIPDLFAAEGEDYFRRLETAAAEELAAQSGLILSCGGGLPTVDASIAPLYQSGTVFWLDRDPEDTIDRLDVSGRPLAQQGKADFLARYAVRAPIYRRWAHHIIRGSSPRDAAEQIKAILQKEERA